MTNTEISMILEKHRHWLLEDCDDWESMKANLSGANFSGINLSYADLRMAKINKANLSHADLSEAILNYADLSGADLSGANLNEAILNYADLSGADLSGAILNYADLSGADLRGVILNYADLRDADLRGADLSGADLSGANFRNASLKDTKYNKKDMERCFPISCPEYGSFIGFKKTQDKIIKLMIPEDAMRSSAFGRKCRCNKALVLAIENIDGSNSDLKEIQSNYDDTFIYKIGETVEVHNFDADRFNECAPGIHFFITRNEAVFY